MGLWRKNLTARQRRDAVSVGRDAAIKAAGNKVEFERLVHEDARTKAIDPALIYLFIKIIWAVYEYYKAKNVSGVMIAQETEDTLYRNIQRLI